MAPDAKEQELLCWVRTMSVGTMDQDFSKQFAGTKMDTILEKVRLQITSLAI